MVPKLPQSKAIKKVKYHEFFAMRARKNPEISKKVIALQQEVMKLKS